MICHHNISILIQSLKMTALMFEKRLEVLAASLPFFQTGVHWNLNHRRTLAWLSFAPGSAHSMNMKTTTTVEWMNECMALVYLDLGNQGHTVQVPPPDTCSHPHHTNEPRLEYPRNSWVPEAGLAILTHNTKGISRWRFCSSLTTKCECF